MTDEVLVSDAISEKEKVKVKVKEYTHTLKEQFSHLKNRLPELSSSGLLVFQSGSFGLRGTLFKADKHYANIKGFAQSQQVDFTRAIADIKSQLKKSCGKLPKRSILISPNVSYAQLSLPVSPVKSKSFEKMQELIRWEMDSESSGDTQQWLIGFMLVERGYLTITQREELIEELDIRQNLGGDGAAIRFGELAVELKYLTEDELQEGINVQQKLIETEEDSIFGFQAQVEEASGDSEFYGLSDDVLLTDSEAQADHSWLVSGIDQQLRKRWRGAFALNGLKLERLYPTNGVIYPALGLRCDDERQVLLEVHPSHLSLIKGSNKNVEQIRTVPRDDGELGLDECVKVCEAAGIHADDIERLYIHSADTQSQESLDSIAFSLGSQLNIDVEMLLQGKPDFNLPANINPNQLLPFIGAANHYLQLTEKARMCSVTAVEKSPPVWKQLMQPKVMIAAGALSGAFVAFGFIGWMYHNLEVQQQRMVELEERWTNESKVKQQYSQVRSSYQKLGSEIEVMEGELVEDKKLIQYLQKEVLTAGPAITGALSAIAESINEGVLIEMVDIQTDSIVMDGRALKTKDANLFAQELNKNLKPWNYQVGNTDSKAADTATEDGVYLDYLMHLEIGRRYFKDVDISEAVDVDADIDIGSIKNANANQE